jgi:lipopolysaccharide export system ATP-binding protein
MPSVKKFRILKFKSKKPPILSVKGISKSINKIPILKNINFNISKGELYGLLGPNGAGKSVTFNCLLGVMKIDQGDIYVEGTKITARPIHERAKRFGISYVSQMDSVLFSNFLV